jgi:hypothetical protein
VLWFPHFRDRLGGRVVALRYGAVVATTRAKSGGAVAAPSPLSNDRPGNDEAEDRNHRRSTQERPDPRAVNQAECAHHRDESDGQGGRDAEPNPDGPVGHNATVIAGWCAAVTTTSPSVSVQRTSSESPRHVAFPAKSDRWQEPVS